MLLFGRASPADCADEDVHNPSVDGLQYVSDSFLHAKSGDFASQDSVTTPTRGLQRSMDNMQRKCTRHLNAPEPPSV